MLFIILGCNGVNYFDLEKDFRINKDLKGVKVIPGPNGNGEAITLTPEIDPLQFAVNGSLFAYLSNTVSTSDDFSFSTMIEFPSPIKENQKWPLIVLQHHDLSQNYFGIGFSARMGSVKNSLEDVDAG